MESRVKVAHLLQSSFISNKLAKLLCYFSEQPCSLDGTFSPLNEVKPVVILAKKHYRITEHQYPATSLEDAKSIVKLHKEQLNGPVQVSLVKSASIDGYKATVVSINPQVLPLLQRAKVLIPETRLLERALPSPSLYTLETPAGELYVSNTESFNSSYANTLLPTAERFALSVGMNSSVEAQTTSQQQFAQLLTDALSQLTFAQLYRVMIIQTGDTANKTVLHALYLGPLLCVTLYLGLTVGWQLIQIHLHETSAQDNQAQANTVLQQKRELDRYNGDIALFNEYVAKAPLVHPYWRILDTAIEQKMVIRYLRKPQNVIYIQGSAPNATAVLSAITAHPLVQAASFDGSIRNTGQGDNFTLAVTPKAEAEL